MQYVVLRRREGSAWSTIATQSGRSVRQSLGFGTSYRFAVRTRTASGSLGPSFGLQDDALQDATHAALLLDIGKLSLPDEVARRLLHDNAAELLEG